MTLYHIISAALMALNTISMVVPSTAYANRIKDLTTVAGVRDNALIGYGLVVGLSGSGDQTMQTPFAVQNFNNMLTQFGINAPVGASIQLKNTATVVVAATLPTFVRPGQTVDVTVLSIGNAKSLRGGTLLFIPLKGMGGQLYALAQGNVVVGGAGAPANDSKVQINQFGVGRIANGATVEHAVQATVGEVDSIQLDTGTTDFDTIQNVVTAVNKQFGIDTAQAADDRTINMRAPTLTSDRVGSAAKLQNIDVTPALAAARVVVNVRAGSVAMNQLVKLEPYAVTHGNLSVTISTDPVVSQPVPFSQGQTVTGARSNIEVKQQGGSLINVKGDTNLADVVKAIDAIGASPQDLISILQAMKAANALCADLEII